MLGVRREHVMTIGDNANDLAMLKWAGLGVAVGNAEERVKREADAVVARRNDQAAWRARLKCLYWGWICSGGIELIVTDLDGTFLNSYHELNEENIEAVHLAQKHGIAVCPVTARNFDCALCHHEHGV